MIVEPETEIGGEGGKRPPCASTGERRQFTILGAGIAAIDAGKVCRERQGDGAEKQPHEQRPAAIHPFTPVVIVHQNRK